MYTLIHYNFSLISFHLYASFQKYLSIKALCPLEAIEPIAILKKRWKQKKVYRYKFRSIAIISPYRYNIAIITCLLKGYGHRKR